MHSLFSYLLEVISCSSITNNAIVYFLRCLEGSPPTKPFKMISALGLLSTLSLLMANFADGSSSHGEHWIWGTRFFAGKLKLRSWPKVLLFYMEITYFPTSYLLSCCIPPCVHEELKIYIYVVLCVDLGPSCLLWHVVGCV